MEFCEEVQVVQSGDLQVLLSRSVEAWVFLATSISGKLAEVPSQHLKPAFSMENCKQFWRTVAK